MMGPSSALRLWKVMVAIAVIAVAMAAWVRVFEADLMLLVIFLAFSAGPLLAASWEVLRGKDPLDGGLLGGVLTGVWLGIVLGLLMLPAFRMAGSARPQDMISGGLACVLACLVVGVAWGALIGYTVRWLAGPRQSRLSRNNSTQSPPWKHVRECADSNHTHPSSAP
jgi:hypothetical protein